MNHRIGIIDCGTNTFNLLIADLTQQGWNVVFSNKVSVKLGHGGFSDGKIRKERLARALDAMQVHYHNLLNFQVKHTKVFATSAIRDASNGAVFTQKVKELFNLDVEIIDGDREAELIYKGVAQTITFTSATDLIVDIGGGSTEFIICNQNGIEWKQSFPIGVARLYEFIEPDDPITQEQVIRLESYLKTQLDPLLNHVKNLSIKRLIGSSGSFDTLVDLFHTHGSLAPARGLSNPIPMVVFDEIHRYLLASTREQRLAMRGMQPLRVDYIVLATITIHFIVKTLRIEELFQSEYALKEGVMSEAAVHDSTVIG